MKFGFTVKLAGGAKREVTAFRRVPGGPWNIRPRSAGKKVWRSLGVVGQSRDDLALVKTRATAIVRELDERRFCPAPVVVPKKVDVATIGELMKAYEAGIAIETDMRQATATDNVRRLRLLVREALGLKTAEDADAQSAAVLTSEIVERWQDGRLRVVKDADPVTRGRARRGADGVLNKARSLFTPAALTVYRKAGLTLPDLDGFLKVPMKGNWNSNAYVPIPDATIAAMDKAAWDELRPAAPATFLTYLMMFRLGMRNSEAEHAQRGWIEDRHAVVMTDGKPEIRPQAFIAITTNPSWPGPKNGTDRRVPIAPDVLEQLLALGAEKHFLGGTEAERYDITHRDVCAFVRRFLPGLDDDENGRVKAAYELRKHFGALVASTQGLDRAAEYLGDRRDTVERHYHAWLQTGTARPLMATELTPQVLAQVA